LNPWKDLLSKIFPDAESISAPEEAFVPGDKPEDPVERIHAMRKIRGSSGFARLYGAKDVEQFARQAAYMRDFADDYPKDIPFGDSIPTYADMSLAQLRRYFTWRAQAMAGGWREIPFSYALLYVFELLNTHEEPAWAFGRLAECWLEMREYHPRLDAKMPQWLKDYYICHEFQVPFGELAAGAGLGEFFPEPSQKRGLLGLSSYQAGGSRFFRECPEMLPVLERALEAAVGNLAPLFALHGVNEEETFFMKPARFSFHELYRDAAALPPAIQGAREVRVSRSEIYRLKGSGWSRALEDAFRPPSHAVGYVVKRLEAGLRRCAGFDAPWSDPDAKSLLERWLHAEPAAVPLAEDPRLPAILAETARAAYAPGSPAPVTGALARALNEEPLRSILALRGVAGFKKQGRRLEKLEDHCAETAPYNSITPEYGDMTHAQLRTYLTWRAKIRGGAFERADTAYALLYARELENSIGTQDALGDLCRFLKNYAPLDRAVARRLPGGIEALALEKQADLPALLAREGAQAWFPGIFLFGQCEQLPVFDQLATYRLTRSRFYRPGQAALFGVCFDRVLEAAEGAFKQAGLSLRQAMQGPCAPALAGFLLKRMEQRLRERVSYPYAVQADAVRMVGPALKGRSRLRAFLAGGALAGAIDGAVDGFAQENDLRPLAGARKQGSGKRGAAPPPPAPPEPPPEVKVDFALLPQIRREADEVAERLTVEDDEMRNERCRTHLQCVCGNEEPIAHSSLLEALTPEQIAIVEFLCGGGGDSPYMDGIAVEGINEVALEVFGDTLIEAHEDGFRVIEEYRENWKEL